MSGETIRNKPADKLADLVSPAADATELATVINNVVSATKTKETDTLADLIFPSASPAILSTAMTQIIAGTTNNAGRRLSDLISPGASSTALASIIAEIQGGGVVIDPAMKARAQKIIDAANAYTPRAVTGSPPTVARSANFAASTIGGGDAGAPTISPGDARLRWTSPLINQFGSWYGGWCSADITLDGGDGWGVGFKTNSQKVEISLGYGRADQTFQGRVNGQWFSASDIALFGSSPDSGYRFITLDFGSTAVRTIELFFRTVQDTRGINLVSGATLSLPDTAASDVNGAIWGDSFVAAGGGLYNIRTNMAELFGEVMGMKDIISQGRSNQGYVLARDGRTISGRMVLDAPKLPTTLDVVYAFGSVNDFSQAAATIQTSVQTGLAALRARFPSAWIIFFSSFLTQNNQVNAARNAAFRDGALAAKGSDPYMIVFDTQAASWPLVAAITGTNPDGSAHDSVDGIHGGNNDVNYHVKSLLKPTVIAALKSAAGIP